MSWGSSSLMGKLPGTPPSQPSPIFSVCGRNVPCISEHLGKPSIFQNVLVKCKYAHQTDTLKVYQTLGRKGLAQDFH